ncbi:hypothetical protein [Corynebacterium qintianiae]|uniref:hypothetical protein n=1 Tax=Corynebacterium qintianiae TaxID=2709392 RepID=UPI0013EC9F51|nr:hypothetical protein [Corynebacterium qintianiae]
MDDRLYYEGAGSYDTEAVRFFDTAHEGAQLRAVAQAVDRFEGLRGVQARSVVVVGVDNASRAMARAVADLRAPLRLPVVVASVLPGYVGPLDVVVVVGDAADSEDASRALITAAARGAETVLAGPGTGPLIDDAPNATPVIPALPTAVGASPLRTFGTVAAVVDAFVEPGEVIRQRLETVAGEVDHELETLSPERDESVNAARQLRAFVAGARVIHTGFERCGSAVAQSAAQLWSAKGIPSGFVERDELTAATQESTAASVSDIFHDPFIDGGLRPEPIKTVVWNHDGPVMANSRAEGCEPSASGEDGTVARLLVRALAATVMNDPLS